MNLRISERQLRFRIARAELGTLLRGESLELQLELPRQTLRWRIEPGDRDTPLALEERDAVTVLQVDRAALASFAMKQPSRGGIEHPQSGLLLVLEVDVRQPSARSA